MSTKPFALENLSRLRDLPFLKPLSSPSFPKFPSLEEIVTTIPATQQRKPQSGLFMSLLGDPNQLYEDALQSPEKYDQSTLTLLDSLVRGTKTLQTLSSEEMTLLDLAVLSFSQNSRKQPEQVAKPEVSADEPDFKQIVEDRRWGEVNDTELLKPSKAEKPRPGIDVPETELPAFWWL